MTEPTDADREAAREWAKDRDRTDKLGRADAVEAFLAGVEHGLRRSGPAWTGTSPVTPGWWWFRESPSHEPWPVRVRKYMSSDDLYVSSLTLPSDFDFIRREHPACQWSDRPLTPPGDATRE